MRKFFWILLIILNSCILVVALIIFTRNANEINSSSAFIPSEHWPTFEKQVPYTINGPLWVAFEPQESTWKYIKISPSIKDKNLLNGTKDPGNPSEWSSQIGEIGYFNGDLSVLPSGTHLNNRYDPSTMAFKYQIDDYMIKIGNFWVDQYESSVVFIRNDGSMEWIDDPDNGGFKSSKKEEIGSGFSTPISALAVSQKRRGTSGLTYFVSEQCAVNNGKHVIRNEQWQAAASGTLRTNATGMESGGQSWKKIEQQDISRYGVVGCAGSLWEWTSSWGQYGQHYDGQPSNWYDWPGPQSYSEWDDRFNTYGDDIIINVAGRAYTKQDSARYAAGLPAALVRGGSWGDHNRAGIFALIADGAPTYYGFEVGFRCSK